MSHLADAVLERTFDLLAPSGLESKSDFSVLALGKLGGEELNFSSDVDLLYVRADGTDFGRTARFARDLTRALSAITAEGRLYRVDLRLRPLGRSGEIVYSLDAYRSYYQTWGDTPDRLALIKCRQVAGSAALGGKLVAIVQEEFVYKRYLDFAAIEEVRWLKRRAERQSEQGGSETWDVKLGRGGIREIEFFAQVFQLLYGGSRPGLRTPNTLDALDRLLDGGLISSDDHRTLRNNYLILRDPGVLEGIAVLEKAPSFPHSPSRMRNLLANLVPRLIDYLDLASKASHLFTRLDRFSEALQSRADLYSELIENRLFRKTLLTVLATSEFLSETLIHNPELLDSVSRLPPMEDDALGMRQSLEQLAKAAKDRRNALRVFKRREEFKVALHDLLEPGTAGTRLRLSHLADCCLRHVMRELLQDFPALRDETFCLLALGKLGEQQMTYHSDLDLLLVYGLRPDKDLSLLFVRLVRRLIQELETYTDQGRAYLMDFQFVVKYLQLQHGIEGRGTRFGISRLVDAGQLDPDEGRVLSQGAGFLFHLEALQRLLAESPVTRLPRDPSRCAVTARLMSLDSGDSLLDRYRIETAAIRQIYRRIFSC